MGFLTTTLAIAAVAGLGAAAAGGGIKGIIGNKKEEASQPTQSTAANDLEAAKLAASERAALANDKRKVALSRSRSIYTSPLGLQGQADLARKTLTGQ